jgi:hypothetical protein
MALVGLTAKSVFLNTEMPEESANWWTAKTTPAPQN